MIIKFYEKFFFEHLFVDLHDIWYTNEYNCETVSIYYFEHIRNHELSM